MNVLIVWNQRVNGYYVCSRDMWDIVNHERDNEILNNEP